MYLSNIDMNAKDSLGWTLLWTLVQMDTKMSSNRFKKPFLVILSGPGFEYFTNVLRGLPAGARFARFEYRKNDLKERRWLY